MRTTTTFIFLAALLLGSIASASPLAKEEIRQTIRKQRDALNGCYRQGLERNARLHGKVVISFTIKQRGFVSDASVVKTTLNDPQVEACIVKQIKQLRFARHSSDMTIHYPFRFQPLDKSASY